MGPDVKTALPAEIATRFLVEFDSACSLLRLYGPEHPSFHRQSEAAAASVDQAQHISIHASGFSAGDEPLNANADLARLAQRLRSLGLVALEIQPGLSARHVSSLVTALDEAERKALSAQAVAAEISARTENHIQATPLKLDELRLVEGGPKASHTSDAKKFWDPLFSSGASAPAVREVAQSFERSLRGSQSSAHWKAMVDVWLRELSETQRPPESQQDSQSPRNLDAAASFLQQLSPPMCQRLLTETISDQLHSEETVMKLADRLPTGTLLGALSSVSRTNGGPSAAALALLRRCSNRIMGTQDPGAAPVTNEEMAEAADTLSKLLGSDHEGTFVPTEYLRRREQLSRPAAEASSTDSFVTWPDERQTMAHAARLSFEILSTPNASVKHLTSSLEYVKNRMQSWVRAGEFALASEAVGLAQVLRLHEQPEVARLAESLPGGAVTLDDLLTGARSATGDQTAIDALADLLGHADGAVLAGALSGATPAGKDAASRAVVAAIVRAFPKLSRQSIPILSSQTKDALPTSLLSVLGLMSDADAIAAAQIILSAAPPAARLPLVELIFRGKHPWPVPLIEELLKDGGRSVRRLAAMRLVRDADMSTAAGFLQAASSPGRFEPDVGVYLAELLHHHRREPALRGAYRQWWWSARRWAALFAWRAENRRQAG
jgi:hypothetical protein